MRVSVLLLVILFFFVSPATAEPYKTYNEFTDTLYIKDDVDSSNVLSFHPISVTKDINYFSAIYEVYAYKEYVTDPVKDFKHRNQIYKGTQGVQNTHWFIQQPDNSWNPYNPSFKKFVAGQTYYIKLVLKKKAELGDVRILSIPMFAGLDLEELTWWDSNWNYRVDNVVPAGYRPIVMELNISQSSGTNTATQIYCNGHCNSDYSDLRVLLDNTTTLPHYINNGILYINVTGNGTVNIYYGNSGTYSTSNPNNVWITYDNFTDGDYTNNPVWTQEVSTWLVVSEFMRSGATGADWDVIRTDFAGNGTIRADFDYRFTQAGSTNFDFVLTNSSTTDATSCDLNEFWYKVTLFQDHSSDAIISSCINNAYTELATVNGFPHTLNALYSGSLRIAGNTVRFYRNGSLLLSSSNTAFRDFSRFSVANYYFQPKEFSNIRISDYNTPIPVWSTWSSELTEISISNVTNNYTNSNVSSFTMTGNAGVNFTVQTSGHDVDLYSWFVDGSNQSYEYDNFSTFIDTIGSTNITVHAHNYSNNKRTSFTWTVSLNFELLTPINGTTIYYNFPPGTNNIDFAWTAVAFPYYNLVIARDSTFSLIERDFFTSSTTETVALTPGTYYWRVRSYNNVTGVFGDFTDWSTFSLVGNTTLTGPAIQGIVYERSSSGVITPLSNAQVTLENLTNTLVQETGSNGYFAFTDLTAGEVYSLSAIRSDYNPSSVILVNTTAGIITQNIQMLPCTTDFGCYFDQAHVTFEVRELMQGALAGVTVSAYLGDAVTTTLTGDTGTDGTITFRLGKTQRYRITTIHTGLGVDDEFYLTPGEETKFVIYVDIDETTWQAYPTLRQNAINTTITTETINTTASYVNVSYIASVTGTTALTVNIYENNPTDPENKTLVDTWTASSSFDNTNHSFIVTYVARQGGQFIVEYDVTHNTYGEFKENFAVIIKGGFFFDGIPNRALSYLAVFLTVFIGAFFTKTTANMGAIIMSGMAWVFYMIGWYDYVPGSNTQHFIALSVVSVFVVLSYISDWGKKERFN